MRFTGEQQAFLEFVLAHYVQIGVEELDRSKVAPLLNLQYGAVSDAILNLGAQKKSVRCLWVFRSISMSDQFLVLPIDIIPT
jgi:hypothetical protein